MDSKSSTANTGTFKFTLQTPRLSSTYAFLAPSCPPSHLALYRHPVLVLLHADGMAGDEYADPDEGSITDGDDHVWLGRNPETLVKGQWRDFDLEGMVRKRPRRMSMSTGWSSSADHDMEEVLGLLILPRTRMRMTQMSRRYVKLSIML